MLPGNGRLVVGGVVDGRCWERIRRRRASAEKSPVRSSSGRNRDVGQAVRRHQLLLPLDADEEEELVLVLVELPWDVDGTADVEAGEVVAVYGRGAAVDVVAPGVGVQIVMPMEEIARAVKILRFRPW